MGSRTLITVSVMALCTMSSSSEGAQGPSWASGGEGSAGGRSEATSSRRQVGVKAVLTTTSVETKSRTAVRTICVRESGVGWGGVHWRAGGW